MDKTKDLLEQLLEQSSRRQSELCETNRNWLALYDCIINDGLDVEESVRKYNL